MPTRLSISRFLAFLPTLLLLGCATTGGAKESTGSKAPKATFYKNVGMATLPDLDQKGRRTLERAHYMVLRYDPPPDVYYETQWLARDPFDDERAIGAVRAQSRIIIRARQRDATWAKAMVYSVEFHVENQVRHEGGDFTEIPATPLFTAYARQLASELEAELRTGVRSY